MSSKFLKPLATAAIVLCALMVRPALASVITLDLATIDLFTQLAGTGSKDPTTVVNESPDNNNEFTKFSTTFHGTGYYYADVGINKSFDWSAFSTFALDIDNRNENTWNFQLFVRDKNNEAKSLLVPLEAAPKPIPNPRPSSADWLQTLTVDLSGIDRANISQVFLRVSAELPLAGYDRTAEYTIRPVPEPASVLMLGTGLAMLGFVAGWRKKV